MSGQVPPQDGWPPDFELPPLGDLLAAPDLLMPVLSSDLRSQPQMPAPPPAATSAATAVDEKLERQRAMNRAKQARFRQRQKVRCIAERWCVVATGFGATTSLNEHAGARTISSLAPELSALCPLAGQEGGAGAAV